MQGIALELMTSTRKIALVAAAAVLFTAPLLLRQRTPNAIRTENARLRAENQQLLDQHRALSEQLATERALVKDLRGDAEEVARLRGEVASLRQDQGGAKADARSGADPTSPHPTDRHTDPTTRMNRGRELRQQGRFGEALQEYLWCFDEGSRDPAFAGVRVSFLLGEIASLAGQFPPARDALVSRRDAAEASVLSGTGTSTAVFEVAALNGYLNEPEKNFALFEQLPAESPHRGPLVNAAYEQFLAAKRYSEIAAARDPEAAFFQRLSLLLGASSEVSPEIRAMHEKMILQSGANSVEVLAGIGESERAKALAEKVLQAGVAGHALSQLIRQAERTGNEDVTAYLRGKQTAPAP